jgi:T5SS/PEP-CTERM-associated repeat protein/autotransporter-associated beta strand protein
VTPNPAAKPGAADNAIFNITTVNTPQTVNLDAAQSAQGLVFNSTNSVLIQSGAGVNTLALGTSGITINPGAGPGTISSPISVAAAQTWINNSSNPFAILGNITSGANTPTFAGTGGTEIYGVLSGSGGLVKNGAGTLNLINSNTFTGGVTINAGTLRLFNSGALNSTTPNSLAFGAGSTGAFNLNGNNVTLGGLSSNATAGTPVVQNDSGDAATLTVNNSITNTYAGVLQNGAGGGALELVKTGAGTLFLTGANTYTGGTTVSNGQLNGNASSIQGNVLNITGVVFTQNGSGTYSGTMSGSGNLFKSGAGTLTLNGNNVHSGDTKVSVGTLRLGSANALGNTVGETIIGSGSTLDLGGQAVVAERLTLEPNASLINSSGSDASWSGAISTSSSALHSLSVGGSGNITLSASINSPGHVLLTKEGANVLNLTGTGKNIRTSVIVNSGVVSLSKTPDSSTHAVTGDQNGDNGLLIAGGTAQLGGTSGDQISDLTGVAVTSGAFDANGRSERIYRLALQGTGIGGKGALVNSASGLSDLTAVDGDITLTGDASIGVTQSGGFIRLLSPISGDFALTKVGAGMLILYGQSSFTGGLNLNEGTLSVADNAALGTGTLVFNGGTLVAEWAPTGLANAVSLASNGIVTGFNNIGLFGPISGAGGLTKSGPAILTLSGENTFTGGVTIAGGTLVQSGGTLPGVVINQASFEYNGGTFSGQLINQGAATFNTSSFTAGNGLVNHTSITAGAGFTFTLNGNGLDNQGIATLAGGTITGAGPLVNNALLSGNGTLAGSGGFTNNSQFSTSGGNITLSNSGANSNTGNIDVAAGWQFKLTGGNLANVGTINLNGGTVSGTATLNNTAGIVNGHGTISSPLSNAGALAIDSGILNVTTAFTNSGEIFLDGGLATLGGAGAITNAGLIRGDGKVAKSVNNNAGGEIRAELGKRIKLEAASGANAGKINLQGGTAEFAQALTNGPNGQIEGRGTLITSGLTNQGHVALSGGITDVFGDVNNATGSATKGITISGNADVTFWDDVTNGVGSLFKLSNGSSVTVFGTYSGAGISGSANDIHLEADVSPGFSPGVAQFGGNLHFSSTTNLKIELGGTTADPQYDGVRVSEQLSLDGALRVSLIDGFAPAAGESFDILDWGSLSGTFAAVYLPELAGLMWDTSQLYSAGVLAVVAPVFLEADFDEDGDVDGDDLVTWKAGFGDSGAAAHMDGDADGDLDVDGADFLTWQRQLGSPAAVVSSAAVPEPTAAMILLTASGVAWMVARRRRVSTPIRRPWSALAIVAAACVSPLPAAAATRSWVGTVGFPSTGNGNFGTASHWNPTIAPGTPDVAVLNLGPFAGGYIVSFPGVGAGGTVARKYSTDRLLVGTNRVVFAEVNADSTYEVVNASTTETGRGIIVGQGGEVAVLSTSLIQFEGVAATIGDGVGSKGTLDVNAGTFELTGSGSSVADHELIIGNHGTGALNVTGGAQVNLTGFGKTSVLGNHTGSNGAATISGVGSTWLSGDMIVGQSGMGALEIIAGGYVAAGSTIHHTYTNHVIGESTGSVGTVTVSGAGSRWDPDGLRVGDFGIGTLNISNGGLVAGGGMISANFGGSSVVVSGADSRWVAGPITVGGGGTGSLTVNDGGKVFSPSLVVLTNMSIGLNGAAGSTVIVDGIESELHLFGNQLSVGVNTPGALNITGGAQVTNGDGFIGRLAGGGTATIDGIGSTWTNSGDLHVGFAGSGTLTVARGGTVAVGGLMRVTSLGTVNGDGNIAANVSNAGVIAPGASAGSLHINGNYTQMAAGRLQIELGGGTPGVHYDQLQVSGNAGLNGTLEVSLINDFAPTAGSSFNILDWAARNGTFAMLQLPPLGGALMWNTSQLYTTGVLAVVAPVFQEADFDEDSDVDGDDLARWRTNFGTGTTHMQADADADLDVDGADFLTWQRQLGSPASLNAAASVPEPSVFCVVLSIAVCGAAANMRRAKWNVGSLRPRAINNSSGPFRARRTTLHQKSSRMRRPALINFAGFVLILGPANVSHAQFSFLYEWNKPAGGGYSLSCNWAPLGFPDDTTGSVTTKPT